MTVAVSIQNLQKSYGKIKAVDDISFTVIKGEVFGILGPNGAGKTTTIRCLTTLAKPDSGKIEVCGISALTNPKLVREKLGYVAQEVALDKVLTGRELLELQASLYHLKPDYAQQRINQLLDLLGLDEKAPSTGNTFPEDSVPAIADRQTGTYSGGLRKRLDLAAGLLHQPEVLVLDEPSVGLDIESRLIIWDLLRQLKNAGTTVIITSHYLEEIDALADRLVIIDQGTVIAEGTPSQLKDRIGGDRITLKIREFSPPEEVEKAQHTLENLPFVEKIIINQAQGNSLNLVVAPQSNPISKIEESLTAIGLPIFSISQARPSLDDVYLAATGRTLMDAELAATNTRDLKAEKKQQMK